MLFYLVMKIRTRIAKIKAKIKNVMSDNLFIRDVTSEVKILAAYGYSKCFYQQYLREHDTKFNFGKETFKVDETIKMLEKRFKKFDFHIDIDNNNMNIYIGW